MNAKGMWATCGLLAVLAGGCVTATPGTESLAPAQLARLDVPKHPDVVNALGQKIHIASVEIDNNSYTVADDRSFWLTPGTHELTVHYAPCRHGPSEWLNPMHDVDVFEPVVDVTLDAQAGAHYALQAKSTGRRTTWELEHSFGQR
jgi:hypothetical protein